MATSNSLYLGGDPFLISNTDCCKGVSMASHLHFTSIRQSKRPVLTKSFMKNLDSIIHACLDQIHYGFNDVVDFLQEEEDCLGHIPWILQFQA